MGGPRSVFLKRHCRPLIQFRSANPDQFMNRTIPGYIDRHIERLEQALAEAQEKARALEQEREAARDAARLFERERDAVTAQVEALNTVLTIERARVDEWKTVADRFAMQAEALAARRGLFGWLRRA